MIGQRLHLARKAAGLSLRELADKIDNLVSPQAIGKYENNQMMPNSSALMALAAALNVTEDFLLSQARVELTGVEFRKQITTNRQEAELEARVLGEVERYLEIEDILAIDSAVWRMPPGFPYPARIGPDAESAAQKLRHQWDLGSDPLPNLVEFLEEHGIKVVCLPLPDEFSGMMCWVRCESGDLPVIVLNERHDGERQRFSLAHELGHLVLVIPNVLDERTKEGLCHRFAGAFLIPLEALVAKVGHHRHMLALEEIFLLKPLFGASAQAIVYRCKDQSIISEGTFRRIFQEFSRRGWRKKEPLSLQPERPARFGRLCLRALAEDCISEAKAAQLLQVPLRQLDGRLHEITGVGELV